MPSSRASDSRSGAWLRRGALAALLLVASTLYADHKDSFRDGMEALDRKRWADVAAAMRDAINQEPQAGERVKLYGMRFETYLPYYYLGLALYEQGDCAGAIDAWTRSESQGKAKGAQRKDMEAKREECRSQLPQTPPPSPPPPIPTPGPPPPPAVDTAKLTQTAARAEAGIATAQNEAKNAAALSRNRDFASLFSSSSPLSRRLKRAENDLNAARQALTRGREGQDLASLDQARQLAEKATGSFRNLQAEARTQQRAAQRAAADATADAQQAATLRANLIPLVANARRLLTTPDDGAAAATLSARRDLEDTVRAYDALSAGASSADLTTVRDRLQRNAAALETARGQAPAIGPDLGPDGPDIGPIEPDNPELPPPPDGTQPISVGPPPQLRNAANAFFQARFEAVVDLLADDTFTAPREQAAAHLLRAAARFGLYREGMAEDETLQQAARQDIVACRRLNPSLKPDPAFFSPAFTAFFGTAP